MFATNDTISIQINLDRENTILIGDRFIRAQI